MVPSAINQMNYVFGCVEPVLDPFSLSLVRQYHISEFGESWKQELNRQHQTVFKEELGTQPTLEVEKNCVLDSRSDFVKSKAQGKRTKKEKNKKKHNSDGDFRPRNRKSTAKANGKKIPKQKKQRNMISNSVHHILGFVQKRYKSGHLIQKIFTHLNPNPNYTQDRYFIFQKLLRVNVNIYVNEQVLKLLTQPGQIDFNIIGEQEQQFYCKVGRIVMRYFLKEEAALYILGSRKVKRDNVREHLQVQRYLYENLMAAMML